MKTKEIVKKYFKLHDKLIKEKQFNKKVELNAEIIKFKKDFYVTTTENDPIITIFIDGIKTAIIAKKYSTRKTNLEYKELKTRQLIFTE